MVISIVFNFQRQIEENSERRWSGLLERVHSTLNVIIFVKENKI